MTEKTFEQNNKTIALNILFVLHNNIYIYIYIYIYISKSNYKHKKSSYFVSDY